MNKLSSLLLLVLGVVLLVLGASASDSSASQFSRLFTGEPTDRALWLLLGGDGRDSGRTGRSDACIHAMPELVDGYISDSSMLPTSFSRRTERRIRSPAVRCLPRRLISTHRLRRRPPDLAARPGAEARKNEPNEMVTIARRFASALQALVTSASARCSRLFGSRRAAQAQPRPRSASDNAAEPHDELVESRRKHTGMALQTLRSSLKAGKITQSEYAARVAQLSETHSG